MWILTWRNFKFVCSQAINHFLSASWVCVCVCLKALIVSVLVGVCFFFLSGNFYFYSVSVYCIGNKKHLVLFCFHFAKEIIFKSNKIPRN